MALKKMIFKSMICKSAQTTGLIVVLFLVMVFSFAAHAQSDLVLHLNFDQSNTVDATGLQSGITKSGSATFVAGQSGQGMKFGGVTNPGYVKVPNSASLAVSSGATYSAWIRLDDTLGQNGNGGQSNWNSSTRPVHSLIAKSGDRLGYHMALLPESATEYRLGFLSTFQPIYSNCAANQEVYAGSTLVAGVGKWVHVAWVSDAASGGRVYVNGALYLTVNCTMNLTASSVNNQDIFLGYHNVGGYNYAFNGALDDVRIYSRALSASEVAGLAGFTSTSTTGEWKAGPSGGPYSTANLKPATDPNVITYNGPASTFLDFLNPLTSPISGSNFKVSLRAKCQFCIGDYDLAIGVSDHAAKSGNLAALRSSYGLFITASPAYPDRVVANNITYTAGGNFTDTRVWHTYTFEISGATAIAYVDGVEKFRKTVPVDNGSFDTLVVYTKGSAEIDTASVKLTAAGVDHAAATAINGSCGAANGVSSPISPSGASLCAAGTASSVITNATSHAWSCSGTGAGATNATCAAPVGAYTDCSSSPIAKIAYLDFTNLPNRTAAETANIATHQFNITCDSGRFGVVRFPVRAVASLNSTTQPYALVKSECSTKTVSYTWEETGQPNPTVAIRRNALEGATACGGDSAPCTTRYKTDPIVGRLAAWICQ
jgi:hypothetical protein